MTEIVETTAEEAFVPTEQEDKPAASVEAAKSAEREAEVVLAASRLALETEVKALRAKHEPIIQAADKALRDAKRQRADAESSATPDHPWEGQTVEGPESSWRRNSDIVRGVVFTYRPGTVLGPGHTYSRPEVGDRFVRLLKKDGKPGLRSVALNEWFALSSGERK